MLFFSHSRLEAHRSTLSHPDTHPLSLPPSLRAMHACMLQTRPFFSGPNFLLGPPYDCWFLFRLAGLVCPRGVVRALSPPSLPRSHTRTRLLVPQPKLQRPLLRTLFLFRSFFVLSTVHMLRNTFTHSLTTIPIHAPSLPPSLPPSRPHTHPTPT